MKHIFTPLTVLALVSITTLSCRKDGHETENRQIVTSQALTATVKPGQTYVLTLGTGSTARITKQASHYEVSEVATATDGNTVYRYTAAKGYTGSDEVSLQQTIKTMSTGGCSGNYSNLQTTTLKTIVVKLNVMD